MSINSIIYDPVTGKNTNVIKKDGICGVHVITNELKEYKNKSVYFSNPTYGINFNQNFSTAENAENVHNGNDNTYWTATITNGSPSDFDFSSTDYAHTGTQSINCSPAEFGDQFQLEDDTEHTNTEFDRFAGWIYITGNWTVNESDDLEIILYNTNTGIQVSENVLSLDNYINRGTTLEWQKFSIPTDDFGLLSDNYNAMRFTVKSTGEPPNFYLDDLVLEDFGTEGVTSFRISPPKGVWWHVMGLGIALVSQYDSTLADSSMPNIPYNGLLGQSLVNGITYQRQEEGKIIFSFVMYDLIEILNQYNTSITNSGYDGNYTWIKIDADFKTPFLLKSEYEDFITMNVSDDLSGLEHFRIVAAVREEERDITGDKYRMDSGVTC